MVWLMFWARGELAQQSWYFDVVALFVAAAAEVLGLGSLQGSGGDGEDMFVGRRRRVLVAAQASREW